MTWYTYAFVAAVLWGIHYNLLAKSLKVISPISTFWLATIMMLIGLPLFWKQLIVDYKALVQSDLATIASTIGLMFTGVIASLSLYKAIQVHNPVHAGLIEVTYPLFIALFAVVLFQENHLNLGTVVGGLLILFGAGIVVYSSS